MIENKHRASVLMGIIGAISIALLVEIFFGLFAFGQTFADFLWKILIFSPVPLIVGSVAGGLLRYIDSSIPLCFSFLLGGAGMALGYFAGVYIYDYLIELYGWGYRFWSFIVPLAVGITFEVIVFGCVWLWRKIYMVTIRTS
jgi:ABC-type phosphate transport system permease subunit